MKEGEKVTDTITVTVDDGHASGKTTQTITVTITGTNDAAIITPSKPGDDAGSVKEDDKLTTGGKLDVTDKDAGEASFKPQTDFKGDHGKFSIDANGNWKYELDNNDPKVQALGVGEKLTETFEVVTADGTAPSPSMAPTTPRSSAARPPAKSPMAATPAPPASSARPTSTSTTPTPGPSATTARASTAPSPSTRPASGPITWIPPTRPSRN